MVCNCTQLLVTPNRNCIHDMYLSSIATAYNSQVRTRMVIKLIKKHGESFDAETIQSKTSWCIVIMNVQLFHYNPNYLRISNVLLPKSKEVCTRVRNLAIDLLMSEICICITCMYIVCIHLIITKKLNRRAKEVRTEEQDMWKRL